MGLNLESVGGGMQIDLLWTNPSPTASFSAKTVSLDLSGYDSVMVISDNDYGSIFPPVIVDMGKSGILLQCTDVIRYRKFRTSATGVEFENGSVQNSYNVAEAVSTNSKIVIPYKIYGINF